MQTESDVMPSSDLLLKIFGRFRLFRLRNGGYSLRFQRRIGK